MLLIQHYGELYFLCTLFVFMPFVSFYFVVFIPTHCLSWNLSVAQKRLGTADIEDQEIFLKALGKTIYYGFGPLVMARVKFRWLHFLGLSNSRMLNPVFCKDQLNDPLLSHSWSLINP